MDKKLYLHIGLHKTATSSIQQSLIKNHDLLLRNGVLYPKSLGQNHSVPIFSMFSDNPEAVYGNIIADKNVGTDYSKQNIEQQERFLREVSENKQIHSLVISGEGISAMPQKGLQKLKIFIDEHFSEFELEIICYVRNPIDSISSEFQELIKGGFSNPNLPFKLFQSRLEKFQKVFCDATWHISQFENACKHQHGPVGYFLEIINVDANNANFKYFRNNESLSFQSIEIIRYINGRIPLLKNNKLSEGRFFKDTFQFHKVTGEKFYLDKEAYIDNIESIEKDIVWLYNNFGIKYEIKNHLKHAKKKSYYTNKYADEFKTAYLTSSYLIKILCHAFLKKKYTEIHDKSEKEIFRDLIKYVQKASPEIDPLSFEQYLSEKKHFQLLRNTLSDIKNMEDADVYRELAKYFISIEMKDAAFFLLCKAKENRPNGPYISKKLEELRESSLMNSRSSGMRIVVMRFFSKVKLKLHGYIQRLQKD